MDHADMAARRSASVRPGYRRRARADERRSAYGHQDGGNACRIAGPSRWKQEPKPAQEDAER